MATIGQRVRQERDGKGYSRRVLSEMTGISATAISDLELGESKRSLSLHRLAAALDVRVEWLETGRGPKQEQRLDGWDDIPAIEQSVAAGDGKALEEFAQASSLKFKTSSLQRKGLFKSKLKVLYASGDSMEPRIRDGDALLVDEDDRKPRNGCIYVVHHEGHYYVKRLHKYGQQWFIVSDNRADPKWKDPVLADFDDGFEVIGRVRWVGSWED